MSDNAGFVMTEQFNPNAMQEFMRRPELYWPVRDALSPQPETVDFITHMQNPSVWTLAATLEDMIIGYVQFVARTTVMVEITVAFHPQCRGKIAKAFTQHAIGMLFRDRTVTKVIACIPADNRAARWGACAIGFREEARLLQAMVRPPINTHILQDIIIFNLSRDTITTTNGSA
jgi:hypothetical protein